MGLIAAATKWCVTGWLELVGQRPEQMVFNTDAFKTKLFASSLPSRAPHVVSRRRRCLLGFRSLINPSQGWLFFSVLCGSAYGSDC